MELEMKLQSAPKSAHPQGWSLNSCDVMAGQNIKKKYLCQISIKMLKQHTDIQFQTQFYITFRLIHQKGAEKLVKDELYMMCSYLNTASNSKYSNFQLKISLQIMGFCFDW